MRRALFIFLAWVLLPFSLAFGAPARAEDTGVTSRSNRRARSCRRPRSKSSLP